MYKIKETMMWCGGAAERKGLWSNGYDRIDN